MATHGQPQMQQNAIVVGSADRFGALVVSTGKEFVKKHPVISLSWVLGLLISILATGFTPAPEAVQNYEVRRRGGVRRGSPLLCNESLGRTKANIISTPVCTSDVTMCRSYINNIVV